MATRRRPRLNRLDQLRADGAALGDLRSTLTPALRLARLIWDAGETLAANKRLASFQVANVVAGIRLCARDTEEDATYVTVEGRLALGIALAGLFASEKVTQSLVASVLLAGENSAGKPEAEVLPTFVRIVRREAHNLALGPGWRRRFKGLEVVDSTQTPAPAALSPDVSLRVGALDADATRRERDVLEVLLLDPDATHQDLAAVLGCTPDTARKALQRLRRRAKNF